MSGDPDTLTFSPDIFRRKNFLITGGGSGIGQAAASLIAKLGGTVTIVGRDSRKLQDAVATFAGNGHSSVSCDFSQFDEASTMMESEAKKNGGFDGVCHAAGSELVQITRLMKRQHIDAVFGAAVVGALAIARAASKAGVVKTPGSLVFLSSAAATRGRAGMALYSTAKAAIEGLTRALAAELAAKEIRVNCIAAGAVSTPMHERITRVMPSASIDNYVGMHPLGLGQASDVASTVAFLLSPMSRWTTASTVYVDGGFSNT